MTIILILNMEFWFNRFFLTSCIQIKLRVMLIRSIMPIRPIAHPLYCPSDLLQHPTYDSCLFLYYLRVRLAVKTISGPSAAARTGQGDERRGQDKLGGHLVKPRASRSDGQQDGWAQVQKYTIKTFLDVVFIHFPTEVFY